jgi:hypothetical protein
MAYSPSKGEVSYPLSCLCLRPSRRQFSLSHWVNRRQEGISLLFSCLAAKQVHRVIA